MPLNNGFEWILPEDGSGHLIGTNTLPGATCGCQTPATDSLYPMENYLWTTTAIYCRYVEYAYIEGGGSYITYLQYADSYMIESNPGGIENAFFFEHLPGANTNVVRISTQDNLLPVNNWADVPLYPIRYENGYEDLPEPIDFQGELQYQRYCTPLDYDKKPPIVYFDGVITATFNDLIDGSGIHHGMTTRTANTIIGVVNNWSSRALDCVMNFPSEHYVPTPEINLTPDGWQTYVENIITSGVSPTITYALMSNTEYAQYLLDTCKLRPC